MNLFQMPTPPLGLECQAEPEAIAIRQEMLDASAAIVSITDESENNRAAACGQSIQRHLKEVEETRKQFTAPYLAAQRTIKSVADAYCQPLTAELDRLSRLAVGYRQRLEQEAEVERRRRAEEIARLQEQERKAAEAARLAAEKNDRAAAMKAEIVAAALNAATEAVIAAPPAEATKTAGQSFQERVLGWECVDPIALWNARPDLCNPPTPKASAIKATCAPERPIPGLKLWWESRVTFRSR